MLTIIRTDSSDSDFGALVLELDKDLKIRDGEEHSFYSQFNTVATIKYVVVVYQGDLAVGCGAIKELEQDIIEVKRMFVSYDKRGKGIATVVLKELERWAKDLGYKKCMLETGKKQPEAIALYTKQNYQRIPNYGQYKGIENSICFLKLL